MAKSRVIFCARDGTQLAEIDCATTRSWVLDEYGKAEIIVPKRDPKCTEDILNFGNRVLIINDTTEMWGGVLYPPRRWGADSVTLTSFSGEFLAQFRVPYFPGDYTSIGQLVE